ncbi:MAG: hypothetical protein D3906_03685, partial [Candidatus Electrothrix sp. AUS1_2]|nr:hypothetical protein [Candidatus Electrothrix sp. AUS1_2]
RNIISGKKSYLRNNEKMYILEPYGVAVYRGWRTGQDAVHRFYFTEAGDSYAGAWGDKSAMGVIAVAAFAERPRQVHRPAAQPRRYAQEVVPAAPAAPSPRRYKSQAAESVDSADSAAGTGYGEGEYSSSIQVEFQPEPYPLETHFYKYEWHDALCRKRIISCSPPYPQQPPQNRFWPDDGYAPPPPRY